MRKTILKMTFTGIMAISAASIIFLSSCGKEGAAGKDGNDGKDASETCKLCHTSTVVDKVATEFQLSKHMYGITAFEEAGNTSCGPCHVQEAFKYVCANNIPATFTLNGTTGKYANGYASVSSAAFGELGCFTCHSSLHTTYGYSDISSLTTVAPVQMTMWAGLKTIDLTQDGGKSNLCIKCHQPRPLVSSTTLSDGNVIDYAAMASNPTGIFYDTTAGATTNKLVPSYRTGVHYGTVGAIYAGKGGVEFGSGYSNSPHTAAASCGDCHMAPITGAAGGHSFKAKGNFNGCNVSNCHSADPISSATTTKYWKLTRDNIKALLIQLAGKLKQGGVEIMRKDATEANLWVGLANNYDGYIDIYDPSSNPSGAFRHPTNTSATNLAKPKLLLTNALMGSIINFQLVLRDYSMGIHNTEYATVLLTNSIAALP